MSYKWWTLIFVLVYSSLGVGLVTWISKRYKRHVIEGLSIFLAVTSILLAIVALIPSASSIYLFYSEQPRISYIATPHRIVQGKDEYYYDWWLQVACDKGKILLEGLYISPEQLVMHRVHPNQPDRRFEGFAHIENASPFSVTFNYQNGVSPFYPGLSFMHLVRFGSKEKKETIKVKLIADMKIDNYKMGFLTVFQPNFSYRHVADIVLDFKNPDPSKNLRGSFSKN